MKTFLKVCRRPFHLTCAHSEECNLYIIVNIVCRLPFHLTRAHSEECNLYIAIVNTLQNKLYWIKPFLSPINGFLSSRSIKYIKYKLSHRSFALLQCGSRFFGSLLFSWISLRLKLKNMAQAAISYEEGEPVKTETKVFLLNHNTYYNIILCFHNITVILIVLTKYYFHPVNLRALRALVHWLNALDLKYSISFAWRKFRKY